jgi:hypothetical protein
MVLLMGSGSVYAQDSTPVAAAPRAAKPKPIPEPPVQVIFKKSGQPIDVKVRGKWSFLEIAPGVRALFAQILIEQPSGAKIKSVRTGAHGMVKPNWVQSDKVILALGAMRTNVQMTFDDGSKQVWTADVILDKTALIVRGCAGAGLKVVPTAGKAAPPVFFGAECFSKENRVIFSPSVAGDMEWDITTIFEVDGKGERWKIFEISKNNLIAGNDVFANLGFNWRGQKTSFDLIQIRKKGGVQVVNAEPKKKRVDLLRPRLDFGFAQFSSATGAASASSMGPLLGAQVLTPDLHWNLRGTASLRYVFPLSKGSFSELSGGVGRLWGNLEPGTSSFGAFGDYIAVNQSQESSGRNITLQMSQFGLAGVWIKTMTDAEMSLSFKYHGHGGEATGMMLEFSYEGFLKSWKKWGSSFRYASQSAKSTTTTSTFGRISLVGTYSF